MRKKACTSIIVALILAASLSGCANSSGVTQPQNPVQTEDVLSKSFVSQEMMPDYLSNAYGNEKPKDYPISIDTKTYIDSFGVQVIEKTYVLPFDVSISDASPKVLLENNIEFGRTAIVKPQTFAEKKVTKDQVAGTQDEAGKFPDKLEYDDTDGKGVLTLDPNSVNVEVNSTEKTPHSKSITKTYPRTLKDYDSIPQTINSSGVTMYLSNVSWADGGDPGTGINGTGEESAFGTYNTVAQSWIATATYGATTYTTLSDYKGTANYVGKILVKNSPTYQYVVTYKPSTMVSNSSGLYTNSSLNSYYNNLNQQLTAKDQLFQNSLGYEIKKEQLETAKKDLMLEKEANEFKAELKAQESGMDQNVVITMMAIMALFLLLIMGALVIAFVMAKNIMERNNLNMTEIIMNKTPAPVNNTETEPITDDELKTAEPKEAVDENEL